MKLPPIIPPLTVVLLKRANADTPDWSKDIGRRFRIGYYRPSDGLDCIWLVNDAGKYEQTVDRATLLKHFNIEHLGKTTDYFGANRPPIARLAKRARRGGLVKRKAATARPQ